MTYEPFGKQRPPAWEPAESDELAAEANLRYCRCSRLTMEPAGPDPVRNRETQNQIAEDLEWLYVHARMSGSPRTTAIANHDMTTAAVKQRRQDDAAADRNPKTEPPTMNGDPMAEPTNPPGYTEHLCADLLASLPTRQRAAITLIYLLDKTYVEAAEELGVAASTVRREAGAAISTLQQKILKK